MSFLERALRIGEGKQFKQFEKRVSRVSAFEAELELETDEELRARIDVFRERLGEADRKDHEKILDEILPEVFAIVREASKRTLGMRHFDVQLVGGMVLHGGSIAEMRTGEGKTLTATLPIVLNALTGLGVHLVTVNDYLARRDAEWMSPIYNFLGLTVGVLQNMQDYETKRAAYLADITYGTNSEFGFDYLRDNMAQSLEERVRRATTFAIVDEVDNILIDEARTPLIISGQPEQAADLYAKFARLAKTMIPGKKPEGMDPRQKKEFVADFDFEFEEKHKTVSVTEQGVAKAEKFLGHLAPLPRRERPARQPPAAGAEGRVALQARRGLRRHRRRGEDHRRVHRPHPRRPALVGGPAPGGRGEGGRARPGGEPDPRDDHAAELLPPLREARGHDRHRAHRGDRVHEDLQAPGRRDPDEPGHGPPRQERSGLQDEGRQVARGGRGGRGSATTPASRCSWARSPSRSPSCCPSELRKRGVPHTVLNAKPEYAEREGEIVAEAGRPGAVTIATNMAGRGVDIKLGGNPEHLTEVELAKLGLKPGDPDYEERFADVLSGIETRVEQDREKVVEAGGLFICGTERHESRRIDNQLRGRAGRQGDPGESRFFLSAEDDLVRLFAGDRIYRILDRLGETDEDGHELPIEAGILSKQIEKAQRKVEEQNFLIRKRVLEYDDVMNEQRRIVYAYRDEVLEGKDMGDTAREEIASVIRRLVDDHTPGDYTEEWDLDGLFVALDDIFPPGFGPDEIDETGDREGVIEGLVDDADALYDRREAELGDEIMRALERYLLLNIIDQRWREHLYDMDYLREGIHLRGFAQIDPLVAYKNEAFELFSDLMATIWSDFARMVFNVPVEIEEAGGPENVVPEPPRSAPGAGTTPGRVRTPAGATLSPRR